MAKSILFKDYEQCVAGQPATRSGLAVHIYTCNIGMENKSMQNSDGDFLIGNI